MTAAIGSCSPVGWSPDPAPGRGQDCGVISLASPRSLCLFWSAAGQRLLGWRDGTWHPPGAAASHPCKRSWPMTLCTSTLVLRFCRTWPRMHLTHTQTKLTNDPLRKQLWVRDPKLISRTSRICAAQSTRKA